MKASTFLSTLFRPYLFSTCITIGIVGCFQLSWGLTVKQGETLPIYLETKFLAEAEKPSVESTDNFMSPGPERFYGWALGDLREYLQQMTKAEFPFMALDSKAQSGIFAGTLNQFPDFQAKQAESKKAMSSKDPEAFLIEVQGDKVFILGKSNHGLIDGIYTFLDKLGCKWFAPGKIWENVPHLKSLVLDQKLNMASAGPSYQLRWYAFSWGPDYNIFRKDDRNKQAEWLRRNRQGGSAYVANFHNDPNIVPTALFETKPELFALDKGKRNSYGLSRANPETVAMGIEAAVKYLKENEGKGSFYNSFSVDPNDGSPACEWSLDRLEKEKLGKRTATDLHFWFANQIAEGIEKAGLKDKWIGIYSYSDHATLPSFKLHPQVAVNVTTALAFSDTLGPIEITLEQRLSGFRDKGCKLIGVYDYPNLVTWSLEKPGSHPAAKPLEFAATLKHYHKCGAISYIGETADSWINSGPGHYLGNRVLWDVEIDTKKELDAYYEGAFGPAAKEIREVYEAWEKLSKSGTLPKIPRGDAAQWYQRISAAEKLVSGKPLYEARITAVKRYYLYLNLLREFEIELKDPKLPSKEARFSKVLRYIASNRGEGIFHGFGLFNTFLEGARVPPGLSGITFDKLDADIIAVSKNYVDENVWKPFPPLSDAQINEMFAAAKLPLDGQATQTFDPVLKVFPSNAKPSAELKFPKLHGPPGVMRQYVLKVTAPTSKLTFQIAASSMLGGVDDRTCIVTDPSEKEIKKLQFKVGTPVTFDLTDVKPGLYRATFPDRGMEELTVTGGNVFGMVNTFEGDTWGYNGYKRSDQGTSDVMSYFLVPAGAESLKVKLTDGVISLGFHSGDVIAGEVKGDAKKGFEEFKFSSSDKPRVAYVKWPAASSGSQGMIIDGVTIFSPNPSYVFYETLN